MAASRHDLKIGDIKTHLVRMTVPMIWGIAAIVSLQLADTYYVSFLGTEKLAAMTFTFPVTMFLFSIIMGFGIAMSSVISRLIGEGREEDVRRVTTHGLILIFAVALTLGLLGAAFCDPIFEAMGASPAMREDIRDYMAIWFIGLPLLALPFAGNSAIRASGDALSPAFIMVGMAALNAAITPVFIFGLFGVPRLELQGAAIGTVIAQAAGMAGGMYVLILKKRMTSFKSTTDLRMFGDSARRILFIAVPAGLTSAVPPFVNAIIVSVLAAYGPETVAAYGIATRIEAFAFIILMALAVGMGPIIGQNFGAAHFARVRETLRKAIMFSIAWSIGTALILTLFATPIAGVFSDDAAVVYYAHLAFLIIAPSYLFQALVNGWASAFNAMGRPQMSVMMTAIKMLILMIPAVHLGAALGGVMGVFTAIAIVNIITGIGFHFWSLRVLGGIERRLAPARA
jgi:putative MATE family efflux protein